MIDTAKSRTSSTGDHSTIGGAQHRTAALVRHPLSMGIVTRMSMKSRWRRLVGPAAFVQGRDLDELRGEIDELRSRVEALEHQRDTP